jgi:aminopeptidase N
MAKQRSSFAKLQRDKAKKERAATKRADRLDRKSAEAETETDRPVSDLVASIGGDGELSAPQLLALIEDLHNRREAGDISLEDFEDAKVELFARLEIN